MAVQRLTVEQSPGQEPADSGLSDLARLAELAREGSLDLTSVAFRVRTDLMVGLSDPSAADLESYVEFAAAALDKLTARDLAIISRKLAGWPHTPAALKAALILRLPEAKPWFEARKPDPLSQEIRAAILATETPSLPATAEAAKTIGKPVEAAMQAWAKAIEARPTGQAAASEPDAAEPDAAAVPVAVAAPVFTSAPASADARAHEQNPSPHAASLHDAPSRQEDVPSETLPPEARLAERVAAARIALQAGDAGPARSLLDDPSAGPAAHAAFFLVASPVQQSLMLSGLRHLTRQEPRRRTGERHRIALARALDLAASDRTGAFLALADAVGGSPEFAARITLDDSRKLAGLCIVAIGGTDEDAVRFALRLADGPAESIPTIFALADMARAIDTTVAWRLVRAIGGVEITPEQGRSGTHLPVADPSGIASRQPASGQIQRPATPQEAARRLLTG